MKKLIAGLTLAALAPVIALGAGNTVAKGEEIRDTIVNLINNVIVPILLAVAFGFFVWGIIKAFFIDKNDSSKRNEDISYMIWGVVAFAVILSIWGLVNLAAGVVGDVTGDDNTSIELPTIPSTLQP
jgi:hypothetical protein